MNIYAGGLVAAGLMAAAFICHWPSDSAAWASWMQAFGTVGAIWGTLWTVDQQNRAQRAERLLTAQAVAIGMLARIGAMVGLVLAIRDHMAVPNVSREEFMLRVGDIDNINLPTSAELRDLLPATDSAAKELMQAVSDITVVRMICERAGRDPVAAPVDRRFKADSILQISTSTAADLHSARKQLIKFLRDTGHTVVDADEAN